MNRFVLDASALMALFLNQPGVEMVQDLIRAAVAGRIMLLMNVVNWGEVYYSVWHELGFQKAEDAVATIAKIPVEIISPDQEMTRLAAGYKVRLKLPYADAHAAALSKLRDATLVTTDRNFQRARQELRIRWVR